MCPDFWVLLWETQRPQKEREPVRAKEREWEREQGERDYREEISLLSLHTSSFLVVLQQRRKKKVLFFFIFWGITKCASGIKQEMSKFKTVPPDDLSANPFFLPTQLWEHENMQPHTTRGRNVNPLHFLKNQCKHAATHRIWWYQYTFTSRQIMIKYKTNSIQM